jgi:hypothetical protein
LRAAGNPIDDFHGAHHGNHALPTTDTKRRIFLGGGSQQTPRWRKPDSNLRSRSEGTC